MTRTSLAAETVVTLSLLCGVVVMLIAMGVIR